MENNKDIQLIENYLNHQLGTEERAAFENRLQEDTAFASEFERHQRAHRALDFMIAKNLKEQLMSLEAEEEKVISINRNRRGRRLLFVRAAAAAVVLFMVGFYFFNLPQGSMSGSEIAASYYQGPDYSIRGGDDNSQTILSRGIEALENKEYNEAISTLDSIESNSDSFVQAQYFQAHAYYQSGEYRKAERRFEQVSTGNDMLLQEDAEWYSLLSCLALNKDCGPKLVPLTEDPDHAYNDQAIAISKRFK